MRRKVDGGRRGRYRERVRRDRRRRRKSWRRQRRGRSGRRKRKRLRGCWRGCRAEKRFIG